MMKRMRISETKDKGQKRKDKGDLRRIVGEEREDGSVGELGDDLDAPIAVVELRFSEDLVDEGWKLVRIDGRSWPNQQETGHKGEKHLGCSWHP